MLSHTNRVRAEAPECRKELTESGHHEARCRCRSERLPLDSDWVRVTVGSTACRLRTLPSICNEGILKGHISESRHFSGKTSTLSHHSWNIAMSGIPTQPPARGLKNKVAIVTGAGCAGEGIGNGRAISMMLANEGCNVVCVDLNLEWAQTTANMSSSEPHCGRAIACTGNVTKAADCESVVERALKEFGRLDILINNVGIGGAAGTAVDVDMDAWAIGLEINVSSMVQMAKYCIPAMVKNEGELKGNIVNMGSVAGLKGGTPHLLYPTSKGAVVNMTRAMAAHHAADGIRVNCVCPGV